MTLDRVIQGLENCVQTNGICQWKDHPNCPYIEKCKTEDYSALDRDALQLLRAQKETIDYLKNIISGDKDPEL